MYKIFVFNHQKDIKLSSNRVVKQMTALLQNHKIMSAELSIFLVNREKIKSLHKIYFNDSSPTDTISFPIEDPKEYQNPYLGDIFVCPLEAIKYAKTHSLDPYDEITLYIIHGFLHLLGYDDDTDKNKSVMQKKEKQCMDLLRRKKLELSKKWTV